MQPPLYEKLQKSVRKTFISIKVIALLSYFFGHRANEYLLERKDEKGGSFSLLTGAGHILIN